MAKSHVSAYTRKDGAFVGEHTDKRSKKLPAAVQSVVSTLTPVSPDEWEHHDGVSRHAGSVGGSRNLAALDVLGDHGFTSAGGDLYSHPDGHVAHLDQKYGLTIKHGGSESPALDGDDTEESGPIEAYGVKGMKSTPWRKTFKHRAALDAWVEKGDGDIELHGTRKAD